MAESSSSSASSSSLSAIQTSASAAINRPVHCEHGRFAGRIIRAELTEIQRPEFGRRFGAVDRRALDDPPVVQLRFFEVFRPRPGYEWSEEVRSYESIPLSGLLCMAELFEARGGPSTSEPLVPRQTGTLELTSPRIAQPSRVYDVSDDAAITEDSNRTSFLFGTKFVEPYLISTSDSGRKYLAFTFADLGVKLEGLFRLRYRFFDLFPGPPGVGKSSVLAECYGGTFTMYSTKEAPALKESTPLTKTLSNHGVPVNIRKKPRPPRRKTSPTGTSPTDSQPA
ncbi:unnamed protein product [Mycena citricolor]|uniref:Velvet domain-containing protein n=1 Tax=Mycena citricolor TaxID=2018698 RepID=A0AAD2K7G2_9AGAR|nr:unnamed protein product [Mycena citricolor]CAK5282882.1 unnamed protein product [Mycena citricolor]